MVARFRLLRVVTSLPLQDTVGEMDACSVMVPAFSASTWRVHRVLLKLWLGVQVVVPNVVPPELRRSVMGTPSAPRAWAVTSTGKALPR